MRRVTAVITGGKKPVQGIPLCEFGSPLRRRVSCMLLDCSDRRRRFSKGEHFCASSRFLFLSQIFPQALVSPTLLTQTPAKAPDIHGRFVSSISRLPFAKRRRLQWSALFRRSAIALLYSWRGTPAPSQSYVCECARYWTLYFSSIRQTANSCSIRKWFRTGATARS